MNPTILSGNYVPGMRRQQRRCFYDTFTVAQSAAWGNKQVMFGRIAGTSGKQITNFQQAYSFAEGQTFTVLSIRIHMLGNALADDVAFMKGYVFALYRGGTNIEEASGPIEYFPAGGGLTGWAATTATTTTISGQGNGTPNPAIALDLSASPIIFDGNDRIQGEFTTDSATVAAATATAAFWCRVVLDGFLENPI